MTFNYDTLIEEAIEHLGIGIKISTLEDYHHQNVFNLFKSHGSVNWARQIKWRTCHLQGDVFDIASCIIGHIDSVEITNKYVLCDGAPPAVRHDNHHIIPAIAIPLEHSKTFEFPEEHLNSLIECLPNIKKILIIGWRGKEGLFLKLVRDSGCTANGLVIAINRQEAEQTCAHINNLTHLYLRPSGSSGFTPALSGGEIE